MIVSAALLLSFVAFGSTFDEELNRLYKTLPRDQFIKYFNSQNFTWTITQYDHLEGKYLNGYKISNSENKSHQATSKSRPKSEEDLPLNFDARSKWPNCETINDIYEQGDCQSGWAIASASAASDSVCIATNNTVRLSAQDTDCNQFTTLSGVCDGGLASYGFVQWFTMGFVTQACKPYDVEKLKSRRCTHKCVDDKIDYYKDKFIGGYPSDDLTDDDDIKRWLVNKGPLATTFAAYPDFIHYKSGIYEHKFGEVAFAQGIKIIGYGEENGVKYWLAANSFGKNWGEEGVFKIKRRQKVLEFEHNLALFEYN